NNTIEMIINLQLYKKEVGITEKEFNIFSLPTFLKAKDLLKTLGKDNLLFYNIYGKKEKELKKKRIYFVTFKNNGRIFKKKLILF
ncbi:MAG: hypothetical protein ABIK78_03745, partial [candidate division WOR-3 bacterium]